MPRRTLFPPILALLLAGCHDAGAPTSVADIRPLRDFANGPSAPGRSGVFRLEGALAFFVTDPAAALMSFHGIDTPWSQLCTGTPPAFDPVDLQFIFTPAGAAEAIFKADHHTVLVYPAADIGFSAGPEDCAVMTALPLLARGQAFLVRTDDDIFGTGGPRVNAFGWSAHGVLDDLVQGGEAGYSEIVRYVIDQAEFPPDLTPVAVSIRLGPGTVP